MAGAQMLQIAVQSIGAEGCEHRFASRGEAIQELAVVE
jgi:hypothetical protein